ncbi:carboxylating nicotinate-nucleotide diphosphorylase [Candidatus Latescibacterota bacterium]
MERTWAKLTDELIEKAIAEDLGTGDVTTDAIVLPDLTSTAFLFTKAPGIIAGIDVFKKVFHRIDPGLEFREHCKDGDQIKNGQKIIEIMGSVASILKGERTALNFLGRMSGIATKTALMVERIEGCHAKILDTRKTIPTMRHLDKYSVRVGGGSNHRYGLFDMVLIKDNHIAIAGTIRIAVDNVMSKLNDRNNVKVEVECQSYDEVLEAVYTNVDIIMLDNMDLTEIIRSVEAIRDASNTNHKKILIEVSGSIDTENIKEIADTGVDYISIGSLTHSVVNHDFTLLFDEL